MQVRANAELSLGHPWGIQGKLNDYAHLAESTIKRLIGGHGATSRVEYLSVSAAPPREPPEPRPLPVPAEAPDAVSEALRPLLQGRLELDAEAGSNANTERAYEAEWSRWRAWCTSRGVPMVPLHPAAVYAYASELADAGKRASTIDRAVAAIGTCAAREGYDRPVLGERYSRLMRGVRARAGRRPRQKVPLMPEDLRRAFAVLPAEGIRPARDRALLTVGLAGAFRRTELVRIAVDHLQETPDGFRVFVPESKTDQAGEGDWVALEHGEHEETCPVAALGRWIEVSGIEAGPVFRRLSHTDTVLEAAASDATVARVVKAAADAAGLAAEEYSGHSLRAGYATAAAASGKSLDVIMRHGRWKRLETVLRYIRPVAIFADHPTKGIGL